MRALAAALAAVKRILPRKTNWDTLIFMIDVPGDDELRQLRKSIDNIDAALLRLLAERFRLTRAVGLLKKREELPAEDRSREEDQINRFDSIARDAGLDPEIARKLHSFLVEEAKKNHLRIREG
jgi:chorismate mutase